MIALISTLEISLGFLGAADLAQAGKFRCLHILQPAASLTPAQKFVKRMDGAVFRDEETGEDLTVKVTPLIPNIVVSFELKNSLKTSVVDGICSFNSAQNQVEILTFFVDVHYQGQGLGTEVLKLLYDSVPDNTLLKIVSTNGPTNDLLMHLDSQIVNVLCPRKSTRVVDRYLIRTRIEQELAQQAHELAKTRPGLVWVRVIEQAGWSLDRIDCSRGSPTIYAKKLSKEVGGAVSASVSHP